MSKAQGDGFKTWTDVELNKYRARLDMKIAKMIAEENKIYKIKSPVGDTFYIVATKGNEVNNQNGNWKWNGWEITGRFYRIDLYCELDFDVENRRPTGLPIMHIHTNDKDEANKKFNEMKQFVKNIKF